MLLGGETIDPLSHQELLQIFGDARYRVAFCECLREVQHRRSPSPPSCRCSRPRWTAARSRTTHGVGEISWSTHTSSAAASLTGAVLVVEGLPAPDLEQGDVLGGALLIGLCEAHSLQALSRRAGDAAKDDCTQLPMTNFLWRFMRYMLAYGIAVEHVHSCVRRTLKRHAPVLGPMAEAYAKHLFGTIEQTQPASAQGVPCSTAKQAPAEDGTESDSTTASALSVAPAVVDDFDALAFGAAAGTLPEHTEAMSNNEVVE